MAPCAEKGVRGTRGQNTRLLVELLVFKVESVEAIFMAIEVVVKVEPVEVAGCAEIGVMGVDGDLDGRPVSGDVVKAV